MVSFFLCVALSRAVMCRGGVQSTHGGLFSGRERACCAFFLFCKAGCLWLIVVVVVIKIEEGERLFVFFFLLCQPLRSA